ncbi:hypothetical protein [Sphingopyxis sp. 550A]
MAREAGRGAAECKAGADRRQRGATVEGDIGHRISPEGPDRHPRRRDWFPFRFQKRLHGSPKMQSCLCGADDMQSKIENAATYNQKYIARG